MVPGVGGNTVSPAGLPAQEKVLQTLPSLPLPSQPPCLLHLLPLVWLPPPQLELQGPQSSQSPQPAGSSLSTVNTNKSAFLRTLT